MRKMSIKQRLGMITYSNRKLDNRIISIKKSVDEINSIIKGKNKK